MAEYTALGLAVKTKLLGPPVRTQDWLCAEVSRDTGLYVDKAYMSNILTGRRAPQKIISSICKILDIQPPQAAETEGR